MWSVFLSLIVQSKLAFCQSLIFEVREFKCDALHSLIPFVQFRNVKSNHGGVLLLVELQVEVCNFIKSNTSPWVLCTLFNCTNGTKSCKGSQIENSAKQ